MSSSGMLVCAASQIDRPLKGRELSRRRPCSAQWIPTSTGPTLGSYNPRLKSIDPSFQTALLQLMCDPSMQDVVDLPHSMRPWPVSRAANGFHPPKEPAMTFRHWALRSTIAI